MALPTTFTEWINPRLANDWWLIMLPAQQNFMTNVFYQFLPSHSDAEIPSYTSGMSNFTSGMKRPDLITGKPSDVEHTWQDVFAGIASDLREAQLIVNVFEASDSIGFTVDTRIKFDGVLWQTTPTYTLLKINIDAFKAVPQTGDGVYMLAISQLGMITDNVWREVPTK